MSKYSKSCEIITTKAFPFFQILTLIFITLKLTGYISWSWWLVLLPIWGVFAFFGTLLLIACILTIVYHFILFILDLYD